MICQSIIFLLRAHLQVHDSFLYEGHPKEPTDFRCWSRSQDPPWDPPGNDEYNLSRYFRTYKKRNCNQEFKDSFTDYFIWKYEQPISEGEIWKIILK